MRHLVGLILAPMLAVALFAGGGWGTEMIRSATALRLIPMHGRDVGEGFGVLLTSGVLALLGAAMIVPLFVPSRWRRRRQQAMSYDDYNDGYGGYDGYGPTDATGLLR